MPSPTDHRALPVYAAGSIAVPYVIDAFDEQVELDTHWAEHSHPTHELMWNVRGISRTTVGARTWMVTPGLGVWMPAGVLHSGMARAGTWYRTSHFGVDAVDAISAVPVTVEITPLLRLLLERLADRSLSEASRRATEVLVLDVLTPAAHELSVHVPQSPVLAPVVEAVLERPGDQRALTAWAAELRVSPRTITRAFRAETGTGFSGWVATVRAERAVTLISDGEDLDTVADEMGYASVSAFGAAFRRTTGYTPSTFR